MGSLAAAVDKERQGAEIVRGAEACHAHSLELLRSLGFPDGVLPLMERLEECGLVRETGFVWMRQKAPYEHFFKATGTRVRYEAEVTAFVEDGKMKRMTGVKSRQMLLWVPIVEMTLLDELAAAGKQRIYFKSAVGIGKSFPASAFTGGEAEAKEGEAAPLEVAA